MDDRLVVIRLFTATPYGSLALACVVDRAHVQARPLHKIRRLDWSQDATQDDGSRRTEYPRQLIAETTPPLAGFVGPRKAMRDSER